MLLASRSALDDGKGQTEPASSASKRLISNSGRCLLLDARSENSTARSDWKKDKKQWKEWKDWKESERREKEPKKEKEDKRKRDASWERKACGPLVQSAYVSLGPHSPCMKSPQQAEKKASRKSKPQSCISQMRSLDLHNWHADELFQVPEAEEQK